MGCLCSRILTDSKNIDISDFTPKHASFEYLSPRGQIIVQIDEKYKLSVLILDFDECVRKSVRLWPQNSVQRNQFIDLILVIALATILCFSSFFKKNEC